MLAQAIFGSYVVLTSAIYIDIARAEAIPRQIPMALAVPDNCTKLVS